MSKQTRIATTPSSPFSSAADDPCSYPRETYEKARERYEARTADLKEAQDHQSFQAYMVDVLIGFMEEARRHGDAALEERARAVLEKAEAEEDKTSTLLHDAQADFLDAFQHMEDARDVLLNCCADVGQAPQHMRVLVRPSPVSGVKANADDFAARLAKLKAALVVAEDEVLALAAAFEQLAT